MKTKVINSLTYVLQLVLVTSEQVYNAFVIVVKTMINNIFFLVYCTREGITFCHIHVYLTTRGGSRAAATSKMESFMIIVNGFHQLTIITKRSILDVAVALDPPLAKERGILVNRFHLPFWSVVLIFEVQNWYNQTTRKQSNLYLKCSKN